MYVAKQDGRLEMVHFDKITARLKKLSYGLSQDHCDPVLVAQKVCAGVYKGVTTSQLDELAAETATAMTASHPDYALEENRASDLFYALWVPDLFMQRVQNNGEWSLFCPNEAPGLADCWGEEFDNLYKKYESQGKANKVVPLQTLWFDILKAQIESGTPYML